jgi:hypothetical protein
MSLCKPALLLLGALSVTACGGPPEARLALDMSIEQAVADDVGTFQVVVLPEGRKRQCTELQRTCLNQQVDLGELLVLRSASGQEARALRFSAGLQGGTQDIAVDVPVGRDYVLVIEALSKSSPPQFLGSSCNYVDTINATQNEPLLAAPITLRNVTCDPTIR